jgi:cyclic pyranopterin phosphate synthase
MEFTHFDENGNAFMVDVTQKDVTDRMAAAEGYIRVSGECFRRIMEGGIKKGDVLGCARFAGIMGAKKTPDLIPLCHLLNLTRAAVDFEPDAARCLIRAVCTVRCQGRTGVEMEALTGVSVALLTIYDMCKAVDKGMEIGGIRLLHKEGGKSGVYDAGRNPL